MALALLVDDVVEALLGGGQLGPDLGERVFVGDVSKRVSGWTAVGMARGFSSLRVGLGLGSGSGLDQWYHLFELSRVNQRHSEAVM